MDGSECEEEELNQAEMVRQLMRLMDEAEHVGMLKTVQRIILLEKEEGQAYTRCETTMKMLRDKYIENGQRLSE